jgi:GxxExxY protein
MPLTRKPLITANITLMIQKENNEYLGAEGYALMGAAFEVHCELNGGLSEEIYQESLEWELGLRAIPYLTKSQLKVYYKGHCLNKRYVPDLHVYNEIIVELKAVKALLPEHEQQLLNYMRITKKAVGYLINFGPMQNLEWERYILKEYIPESE